MLENGVGRGDGGDFFSSLRLSFAAGEKQRENKRDTQKKKKKKKKTKRRVRFQLFMSKTSSTDFV